MASVVSIVGQRTMVDRHLAKYRCATKSAARYVFFGEFVGFATNSWTIESASSSGQVLKDPNTVRYTYFFQGVACAGCYP